MKKIVFVLSVAFLMIGMSACKSKEKTEPAAPLSINWQGTYTGTLPCADCPGIQTQITLSADNTYKVDWQYLDKENVYTQTGTFQWNESDSIVTLDISDETPFCYKVGENTLTQLDMDGNAITGELAENYVLVKQ
jgi:uncharacterized lipoprotein NlpE involved in copper resistance